MFSAWDFQSWIASVGIVLLMGTVITAFAWLVNLLLTRIWGEEPEIVASPRIKGTAEESPIRKAA